MHRFARRFVTLCLLAPSTARAMDGHNVTASGWFCADGAAGGTVRPGVPPGSAMVSSAT